MPFTPTDLEAYVRQRAPEIARGIRAAAQMARVEADLVAEVEKVLDKFSMNFDVTLHLERERTLINGRADAVYNRFVIEYEPPNSLQRTNTARTNKHAIGQVQQYIEGMERLDRHRRERLAGVVLDGRYYIFVRYRDDRWHIDEPLSVDTHSTETFLRYLLSLSTELALTPENLVRDFGENSNTARQVVPALYQVVCCTDHPKVCILFQQWQRQFQEVSGYDPASGQLDTTDLARLYAVRDAKPDLEHLFFAIHTYYAAFIKLLALQVAHYYLMPKVGTGLAAAADYPSDKLRLWLRNMEAGGLFKELGIRNFLEGDFFGWYLDAWEESIDGALRRLVGDLANYSLVTLDVDPEETRDLLKQLYQNLMPKKLRHALGEYYTPDWLAERLLNQLGYDGNPIKRILDPACGSGTFPVLAVKRARKYADDKMLPQAQVLEQILENIVGFDLNPLAVMSARTNYLLALGDLLEHRRGEISIPIYLADSILTPGLGSDLFSHHGYSFNTAVGRFSVPRSLVQARYIDRLADLLEESVRSDLSSNQFLDRLLNAFPLKEPDDDAEIGLAKKLFSQLIELEQQGVNGIWARILKNAFAPLFQGEFDYIAGNPPWVNWESLPQDYRNDTADLWKYYGMEATKGKKREQFELGKQKRDISTLMTYVAADKYLRDKGRLGFIITQSVFKTMGGEGFRRFQIPDGPQLQILFVDDMSGIKPFEGASNRTSIFILEKGHATKYPIPYGLWYRPDGGRTISENLTLDEITQTKTASLRKFIAQPVDHNNLTSPWISGRPRALKSIKKVLGKSDYRAKAGACTWLNGVYWVDIVSQRPDGLLTISNLTETSKQRVDNVQVAVEPDLLYPLLRGRDVQRWQGTASAYILMPHTQNSSWQAIPEGEIRLHYPKTYAYFDNFRAQLEARTGYQLMRKGHPFYILVDVHTDTFDPFKVIWREQASGLTVAVVEPKENKVIIPDHKLMMVAFKEQEAAYYLCGALNSSPSQFIVLSYGVTIQMDTHVLENVGIPAYDHENPVHRKLSSLAKQAQEATDANDLDRVREIEIEIDQWAALLWGLAEEELREIQESLEELH